MHSCILKLAVIAVVACGFWAGPSPAQPVPLWMLAQRDGSDRVLRHALRFEQPQGAEQAVARIDRAHGFPGPDHPRRYALPPSVALAPEFGFDPNFNGGFEARSVTISGLEFEVEPASRARPELYAGVRAGFRQVFVWSEGQVLSVQLAGTWRQALGSALRYRDATGQVCSETHPDRSTGVDLCLRRTLTWRERGRADVTTASLGVSRVFAAREALIETSATLAREFRSIGARTTASLGARRIDRRLGALSASLFVAEPVPGLSLPVLSATLGYGRYVGSRYWRVGVRHMRERGGRVVGQPLERNEYALTLTLPEVFGVVATVGYQITRHNLRQFDRNQAILSLEFAARGF